MTDNGPCEICGNPLSSRRSNDSVWCESCRMWRNPNPTTASGVHVHVSTGSSTMVYPCTAGMGWPVGYHHFEANAQGVVVCTLCGKKPS